MDIHSFEVLNLILYMYSNLAIKKQILDSFLTLEIVCEVQVQFREFGFTHGEARLMNKYRIKQQQRHIDQQPPARQENYQQNIGPSKQDQKEQKLGQSFENINTSNIFRSQTQLLIDSQYPPDRQSLLLDETKPKPKQAGRPRNPPKWQKEYIKFNILCIHQHGDYYSNYNQNAKNNITNRNSPNSNANGDESLIFDRKKFVRKLFNSIDDVFVVFEDMTMLNNVLATNQKIPDSKPMLILVPTQPSTPLQLDIQSYLEIISLYSSHLNLRIVQYPCPCCPSSLSFIENLIKISQEYRYSEDDLDVILREDIPENCYIKVLPQKLYKANLGYLCQNGDEYRILRKNQGISYSFLVKEKEKDKEELRRGNQQKKELWKSKQVMAADVLIIWVLIKNQPMLRMLPFMQEKKKGRKKNGIMQERYKQTRSPMGYTILQMEDKLYPINKPESPCLQPSSQIQSNNSCQMSNASVSVSNLSTPSLPIVSPESLNPSLTYRSCTCIINIEITNLSPAELTQVIQKQMGQIWKIFIEERRNVYQDLEIQNSMKNVERLCQILKVSEKDVFQILYLSKI